ncbi:MAG: hypothetical protein AAFN05_01670 [Pseudomonadota bacterium]
MTKPNNFPREGLHTPVTSEAIKRLEAERPTLNVELHYTIGGTVEAEVHSNANAEREAAITNGSRRLQESTAILRGDFEHENSRIRAAFVRALYVREQQALAKQGRSRQRTRSRTRSC